MFADYFLDKAEVDDPDGEEDIVEEEHEDYMMLGEGNDIINNQYNYLNFSFFH